MSFYNFGVYEALIKLGLDPSEVSYSLEDVERSYGTHQQRINKINAEAARQLADIERKKALRAAQEAKDVEVAQSSYKRPAPVKPRATPPPIPQELRGTMPGLPSAFVEPGTGTVRAPSPERWRTMSRQPTATSFVDPALAPTRVGPAPIAAAAETAAKAPVSALTKFRTFLRSMRPFIPKG